MNWISVKDWEELPFDKWILAITREKDFHEFSISLAQKTHSTCLTVQGLGNDIGYDYVLYKDSSGAITYWMPLPIMPKEEE